MALNDWRFDIGLVLIFILITGIYFSINKYDTYKKFQEIKDSVCMIKDKKFNIPDKTFTDNACELAGYDWGIIDTNSKCGTSVECFKSVGSTITVDCFELG